MRPRGGGKGIGQAGTMPGVAGVPMRIRQLFMRHGDIRLTMGVYDDEDFSAMEETIKAFEKAGLV